MPILLINPATPAYLPNKEFVIPQSLLSLAGVVEQAGMAVSILDLNTHRPWDSQQWNEQWWQSVIAEHMDKAQSLLVGIGCLFSGQFSLVRQLARFIKVGFPQVAVVIGGMHPSIFAGQIIAHCPEIDYVVIGEGERQFAALVGCLTSAHDVDASTIEGLAYRHKGQVCVQPQTRYIQDLDNLPMPAYHLIDFNDYAHRTSCWHNPKGLNFNLSVPLLSSRSCPNRCNFCSMYQVMGPRLRKRSPDRVVDEIQLLYEKYGQNHFSFMDDNLNLDRRHILRICHDIRRRGLNIQYETPNGLSTANLDAEVMQAMVASGWIRGAIAIESGSDYIRNQIMSKRLSRKKIEAVVHEAKKYPQLHLKAYYIIGMPEDTDQTLQETHDMICQLRMAEVYVTNLMPFAGTPVFEQACRDRLFVDDFDVENLWQTDGFHYHNNHKFYIKPYRMEMDQLFKWREAFDRLLASPHSQSFSSK